MSRGSNPCRCSPRAHSTATSVRSTPLVLTPVRSGAISVHPYRPYDVMVSIRITLTLPTVPLHRRLLLTGLSLRSLRFKPGPAHVRFIIDKLTLDVFLSEYVCFRLSILFNQCFVLTHSCITDAMPVRAALYTRWFKYDRDKL